MSTHQTVSRLAAVVVLTSCVIGFDLVRGQSAASGDEDYKQAVLPFITKSCFTCHNPSVLAGGLNLEAFPDAAAAAQRPEVWSAVRRRLSAGEMPPMGLTAPEKESLPKIIAWIDAFGAPDSLKGVVPEGDPGRLTIRRLNRNEYNNTIRDLLGVGGHPADEFPIDDAGYGFDNNGDVLSLPPLLMEKYIASADKISQVAVYGPEVPAKPGLLIKFMPATGPSSSSANAISTGIVLPYSLRGIVTATWDFPKDAEYEFGFHTRDWRGFLSGNGNGNANANGNSRNGNRNATIAPKASGAPTDIENADRGRGAQTPEQLAARHAAAVQRYPAAKWSMWVDGKDVLDGEHAGGYSIDAGDSPEHVARVHLTAGQHTIRLGFLDAMNQQNPLDNLLKGANFVGTNGLRALEISDVDIRGPYNPNSEAPLSYRKIFICTTQDAACARRIVANLTTRAFRRPSSDAEIIRYIGIFNLVQKQGKGFNEGIRSVVEAVLLSPEFLFRIESDPVQASKAPGSNIHFIDDYELASRLSYFLWSTMPDDELISMAAAHKLRQSDVLNAEVKRMLADPKAQALTDNFAGQWLGLPALFRNRPDPDKFPVADGDLLTDMTTETKMFFTAMVKENRSIFDFIDGPFTYLNGPLAAHYGIPGVRGQDFRRVELDGNRRSGILTQAAILTVSSFTTRTSVVTRGKWVLDNLLGTPPPPPPPDVPSLKDSDIGTDVTLRERMQQHRANPACAACHARMDPIGFGLENYDATGKWRTMDGKFPIDASGVLPGGRSFNGAAELKKVLRSQSDLFAKNLTEKMLTYALGRGVEPYDDPAINDIMSQLKANDYKMDSLILGVVNSKPFLMRDGSIQ